MTKPENDNEKEIKLAMRPNEAAKALGISRRKLDELAAGDNGLPRKKIGTSVLYPVDELKEWLSKQNG